MSSSRPSKAAPYKFQAPSSQAVLNNFLLSPVGGGGVGRLNAHNKDLILIGPISGNIVLYPPPPYTYPPKGPNEIRRFRNSRVFVFGSSSDS